MLVREGVPEVAVPDTGAVVAPVCVTLSVTETFNGCNWSAPTEFHLANMGCVPLRYLVKPSALAVRVTPVLLSVSAKAPDSAAKERKSVVVGLVVRLVDAPEADAGALV